MILVKFSEDDRISTSQEPIIFIVKRGRGDTEEKRPGVPSHLLEDLDWDKEQSAPEIQALGPGFALSAGLSLGKKVQPTRGFSWKEQAAFWNGVRTASALMRSTAGTHL